MQSVLVLCTHSSPRSTEDGGQGDEAFPRAPDSPGGVPLVPFAPSVGGAPLPVVGGASVAFRRDFISPCSVFRTCLMSAKSCMVGMGGVWSGRAPISIGSSWRPRTSAKPTAWAARLAASMAASMPTGRCMKTCVRTTLSRRSCRYCLARRSRTSSTCRSAGS